MTFHKYLVLDKLLLSHKHNKNLNNYFIISVQHLLNSSGSMFEKLLEYGFKPNNIFLTGKIYSTHHETKEKIKELGINVIDSTITNNLGEYAFTLENDIKKMWKLLEKKLNFNSKIIILDDGGYTLKNAPEKIVKNYKIYGIEQTTSGIKMQKTFGKFPVIHLASSANKVLIEPKIVSEAVKIQLGKIIEDLKPKNIGVVGYGHIGKAIVKEFESQYKMYAFDIKNELNNEIFDKVEYCYSLKEILNNVDILIGATGQDISNKNWINIINKNLTLISVSSGDIEFNSLLKVAKPFLSEPINTTLDILNIKISNNKTIKILRGGMVANFTGTADSSPGNIIQVTRGLLFSAIIQIIENESKLNNLIGPIMLSPHLQKEVTNYWFNDQPNCKKNYSENIILGFENIDWIKENSGGNFIC